MRDSHLIRKLLKAGMSMRKIAALAVCSHGVSAPRKNVCSAKKPTRRLKSPPRPCRQSPSRKCRQNPAISRSRSYRRQVLGSSSRWNLILRGAAHHWRFPFFVIGSRNAEKCRSPGGGRPNSSIFRSHAQTATRKALKQMGNAAQEPSDIRTPEFALRRFSRGKLI